MALLPGDGGRATTASMALLPSNGGKAMAEGRARGRKCGEREGDGEMASEVGSRKIPSVGECFG